MVLIFLEGAVSYPAFSALPPETPVGWLVMLVGAVGLVAGATMVYRGIDNLGGNLAAHPAPVADATLVEHGIYRRVRHPIYAGVILLAIGWAFFVGSPAALVVALLLATWLDLKSRREEVWLLAHHAGYAAYRRRTNRFVPGLY